MMASLYVVPILFLWLRFAPANLPLYPSLSTYPSIHPFNYMHVWIYICKPADLCFIVCALLKFGICVHIAFIGCALGSMYPF